LLKVINIRFAFIILYFNVIRKDIKIRKDEKYEKMQKKIQEAYDATSDWAKKACLRGFDGVI